MGRRHAFGRLIGNSDMHHGNIAFHFVDRGPLPLAPVYDMLPMSLAPSKLGVLRADEPLSPVAPLGSGDLQHLRWAAPVAEAFWQCVAVDGRIQSPAMRSLAGRTPSGCGRWARGLGEPAVAQAGRAALRSDG